MKNRSEIELLLKQHRKELETVFFVKEIGFFGSFVRNEQSEKSDVDILVEFDRPVGMFHFLGLEERLSKMLDTKVDLVTKKSLKPIIGRQILAEVVYI